MTLRISIIVPLLGIVLSAAEPPQSPQYRGINGTGIATGLGPVQFGPKQNVEWSLAVPTGHSSPSIWGEHLFITSFDASAKKFELLAINRKTGKFRWRQTIPASEVETVHDVSSPATATPIVDGERVYAYFGSAGVFCYDFDGKLLWSSPLPVAKANFGSGASPVLVNGRLLVPRDGNGGTANDRAGCENGKDPLDERTWRSSSDERACHARRLEGSIRPAPIG